MRSVFKKDGAHYNIFAFEGDGMGVLKNIFPEGEANEMNFVLFSTSGVHGTYTTLDEIEASYKKYGVTDWPEDEEIPDDFHFLDVTTLIVHPRLVCLKYGSIQFEPEDFEYLKKLRDSSSKVVASIGF